MNALYTIMVAAFVKQQLLSMLFSRKSFNSRRIASWFKRFWTHRLANSCRQLIRTFSGMASSSRIVFNPDRKFFLPMISFWNVSPKAQERFSRLRLFRAILFWVSLDDPWHSMKLANSSSDSFWKSSYLQLLILNSFNPFNAASKSAFDKCLLMSFMAAFWKYFLIDNTAKNQFDLIQFH
uniref:(northern house mosquito) hypothetical protein n=1 Tax=Culex pipiens TaxID=7175 RepID=A0A8D8F8N0_CULPI